MRILKKALTVFIVIIFTGITAYAEEPKTKKEEIPADIPPEIGKQIKKLRSLNAIKRRDAARKLGEMGEKAVPAIPFLIELLADDARLVNYTRKGPVKSTIATYVGEDAAKALSKIGTPAIEPLIPKLKDSNPNTRKYAAFALGLIKDKKAVEPLINALGDDDPLVQRYVTYALGKITGEDFGDDKAKWQKWLKEHNK
jgi:HEAT repeat protein